MSDSITLQPSTTLVRISDQVSGGIDGKVVILVVSAGEYHNMNEVGSRIWALLEKPTTLAALVDTLVAEFEVEQATCERETRAFLAQLLGDKLVTILPAQA